MVANKTHRVFFALWPDKNVRQEMERRIKPLLINHSAKIVPVHNWHITLAFLGNVSEEVYQCIQQQADKVTGQSFLLKLDTFDYWKRPQVAWLGCETIPDELQALFSSLNEALGPCGYTPKFSKFAPHMTILRKTNSGLKEKNIAPVQWQVNEFVLVESQTNHQGSTYNIVKKWTLL